MFGITTLRRTQISKRQHGGAIVLIVGPSGAGKDSVIAFARSELADDPSVVFARRLITRRDDGIEEHEPCSDEDFAAAEAAGDLALSWRAHGIAYGIRKSIACEIANGRIVVANVSRRVIPAGLALAPCSLVVQLTASPKVLAYRLAQRGRDSEDDIAARLARDVPLPELGRRLLTIDNDGPIERAGAAFLEALLTLARTLQKRHARNDPESRA